MGRCLCVQRLFPVLRGGPPNLGKKGTVCSAQKPPLPSSCVQEQRTTSLKIPSSRWESLAWSSRLEAGSGRRAQDPDDAESLGAFLSPHHKLGSY